MNIKQINILEHFVKEELERVSSNLFLAGLPTPCNSELTKKLKATVEDYFNVLKRRSAG